jgi:hypothetical protein
MKVDMSPAAVTRRLRRVGELVRVCRALAGPRQRRALLTRVKEDVKDPPEAQAKYDRKEPA